MVCLVVFDADDMVSAGHLLLFACTHQAVEENALGLRNGPGHCELRLDRHGRPVILEIGARIGGSGCAHFNGQTFFTFLENTLKVRWEAAVPAQ